MASNQKSWIERAAEALHMLPKLAQAPFASSSPNNLQEHPPPEQWDSWGEWDANAWPQRVKRHYSIVPTTCFNCESACGMLAYIDKETGRVRKFEGNPHHPGSRGRNCAKGPATINQIQDPERILYPLKRKGPRGSGQWERVSWNAVLDDISGRIRKALQEERRNEVVYHVGRPGHEGYMDRVLKAWGVDGHNSHTNICSSAARLGYNLWQGIDRPSADFTHARFILLLSSHLETGHYFNPHAQRILEGMSAGAELAVMDPRLSNTASMAKYWLPTQPGSEAAVLLAIAKILLDEGLYDRTFVENWVNWREWMESLGEKGGSSFEQFIVRLRQHYARFTPEFAAQEARIPKAQIVQMAARIGAAGKRFASHSWRGASTGNLGGWQVSRCLHFLHVLTGSVGEKGGVLPAAWSKFKPTFFDNPPAVKFWNELHFPKEYPLAHFEMSPILPHMLKQGRGKMDVYFTRVFNPVWTYPDGFSWIEALQDESKIGMHIAMTPTWNETAYYADYVLPMGHASERHDLNSYETHAGMWIAFRQPVLRRYLEKQGKPVEFTYQANPGEVWEEDEFWMELSWRIDPDSTLGVRKHFLSPYRKGEKISVAEYYQYIFDHTKGLPQAAKALGMTPYEYMCQRGAFLVEPETYQRHTRPLNASTLKTAKIQEKTGLICDGDAPIGVMINDQPCVGFPTPSRKQELYSLTMVEWGWPEYALPGYIKSHVHPEELDEANAGFVLLPTFRLPNMIHSRSANAKWLVEISHRNPVWMNNQDAKHLGFETGDLIKVHTEIGYFIDKVWACEAIKPGVIACSHHIGRWRTENSPQGNSWMLNTVTIEQASSTWRMRTLAGPKPFQSSDADSSKIAWNDGGVHQNITHAAHPDPISGMHCWHQRIKVSKPTSGEHYGDIEVNTQRSLEVYQAWLKKTRPPQRQDGLRRPLWLPRPLRPVDDAFYQK